MSKTLEDLKAAKDNAHAHFTRTLANLFPGADEWTWYRAVDHMQGLDTMRNEDTSRDEAMACSAAINAAHDAYICAVSAYHDLYDSKERGRRAAMDFIVSQGN